MSFGTDSFIPWLQSILAPRQKYWYVPISVKKRKIPSNNGGNKDEEEEISKSGSKGPGGLNAIRAAARKSIAMNKNGTKNMGLLGAIGGPSPSGGAKTCTSEYVDHHCLELRGHACVHPVRRRCLPRGCVQRRR